MVAELTRINFSRDKSGKQVAYEMLPSGESGRKLHINKFLECQVVNWHHGCFPDPDDSERESNKRDFLESVAEKRPRGATNFYVGGYEEISGLVNGHAVAYFKCTPVCSRKRQNVR